MLRLSRVVLSAAVVVGLSVSTARAAEPDKLLPAEADLVVQVNVKQILIYLTIAFVVVTIWNSQTTTGNSVGTFLGSLGSFLVDLVNRFTSFVQGLKG